MATRKPGTHLDVSGIAAVLSCSRSDDADAECSTEELLEVGAQERKVATDYADRQFEHGPDAGVGLGIGKVFWIERLQGEEAEDAEDTYAD